MDRARGEARSEERGGARGIPWIFVHGFPLDRRMWDETLALLPDLEAHALDLPGFGGQPPILPPESVQLADFAAAVLRLADDHELGRFGLAGLSMGGYIVFECWRRFPERIGALILADTRAEADSAEGVASRRHGMARALAGEQEALTEELLTKLLAPESYDRSDLLARLRRQMRDATPEGIAGALHAMLARPSSLEILPRIDVPALIVVGEDDRLTPVACSERMAAEIPESELVIVPRAGHMAPMEDPTRVADAIRDFVRGVGRR